MTQFITTKVSVEPCGTAVQVTLSEPIRELIGQLCEDGHEAEIHAAIAYWRGEETET